ncbi:hypothetical protein NQZ68_019745 [Dissostichus eleginoides]|nr:hypothetical protein NQZ68_019745 [Dissostichus eleginoides]
MWAEGRLELWETEKQIAVVSSSGEKLRENQLDSIFGRSEPFSIHRVWIVKIEVFAEYLCLKDKLSQSLAGHWDLQLEISRSDRPRSPIT